MPRIGNFEYQDRNDYIQIGKSIAAKFPPNTGFDNLSEDELYTLGKTGHYEKHMIPNMWRLYEVSEKTGKIVKRRYLPVDKPIKPAKDTSGKNRFGYGSTIESYLLPDDKEDEDDDTDQIT